MYLITMALTLSVTSLLSLHSSAEESSTGVSLEEVVVVASRLPQPHQSLGVSVAVITADDIGSYGYADLGSILATLPGVQATQDGGLGKAATVRIRGEEGYRTRVILDGIDIADPSSTQVGPRFEQIMNAGLERVEVLRGPQGLVWGADAGGVVLLESRTASSGESLGTIELETGAQGFNREAVQLGLGSSSWGLGISASHLSTDGINARVDDQTLADRDGYTNNTLHTRGIWTVDAGHEWFFSGHAVAGKNDYDQCYDVVSYDLIFACSDEYQQQAWRTGFRWIGDTSQHEFAVQAATTERRFFSNAMLSYATEGETQRVTYQSQLQRDSQRWIIGADIDRQRLHDDTSDYRRDNVGIYSEWQQTLGSIQLTGALRFEDNDDFGQHLVYRATINQTLDRTQGKALIGYWRAALGTGFRAPSLYELAYNAGPYAYGEATTIQLNQEETQGWEVAVGRMTAQSSWEIVWFDQSINNEIYFDLEAYAGYLQRAGQSTSRGVEASASYDLTDTLVLSGNMTWNDTETRTGEARPYRPRWSNQLSLLYDNSTLQVRMSLRDVRDTVDTLNRAMPDYRVLDTHIRWQFAPRWRSSLRIENLANRNYQQLREYHSMGRGWYAGLQYSL
jgi:vitamin B12 transporter